MTVYSNGGTASFAHAIESCVQNYIGFAGRAPRSEYWYWCLACLLFGVVFGFAGGVVDGALLVRGIHTHIGTSVMIALLELLLILPSFAVQVRRLHDTNHSGWWLFVSFVPLLGGLLLLVWLCSRGTPGDNRYGADPQRGGAANPWR